VEGEIAGIGPIDMLVDTGSGYLTINEAALNDLLSQERAGFVKRLTGVLADGSELVVPVYSIDKLRIGPTCWLHDIEAAVFPGKTRFILGLSALQKAGPFIFDFDPPSLTLSRCETLSS
jgi:predicted aspartyl protease